MPVIGLLHPGDMGAQVGRCLTERGHDVLWASECRGPQTTARAATAGLADAGTIAKVARRAAVIMSVCPPHAAAAVAAEVAAAGFRGLYLDANAVSPATAGEIAAIATGGGATYVDGGIIGPPPAEPGTTRLYLSGVRAGDAAALFEGSALTARVLKAGPFAASGVKMAYAAWTKGSAALLLAARALAEAEGVADALLGEWELSQPALARRAGGAAQAAVTKGWRWVGEMDEIAAAMAAAGLPDGFHLAAAEVYRRSPRADTAMPAPAALDAVIAAIR